MSRSNPQEPPCTCSPSNSIVQDAVKHFYKHLPDGEVANGIAIGVINGADSAGNPNITTCYCGYANVEQQTAIGEDTVFEIGSVTKTFTTTMLAQAAHQGLVALSADAQSFFSTSDVTFPVYTDADGNTYPITILDLADYTSGIPDKSPTNTSGHGQYSVQMMYDYLNGLGSLTVQPGTEYKYVNTNFGILADVVKSVNSFDHYRDALSNLISAADLQMPNTLVTHHDHPSIPNLAQGYRYNGDVENHYALPTWPALVGAGGIYSTLSDMLYWLQFNMGMTNSPYNGLLQTTQSVQFSGPKKKTGLGWLIGDVTIPPPVPIGTKYTLIYKDGGTEGFHSWIGFLAGAQIGIVLLCNGDLSGSLPINNGSSPIDDLGKSILKSFAENSFAAA